MTKLKEQDNICSEEKLEEQAVQPEQDIQTAAPEEAASPEETAGAEEKAPDLQKELTLAETALEKAQKELEETRTTLMRTAAEYDNYRKRTTKEKEGAFNNGVGFAVSSLLTLIDTLESAEAAPTADEE